jgi:hypothetical protein
MPKTTTTLFDKPTREGKSQVTHVSTVLRHALFIYQHSIRNPDAPVGLGADVQRRLMTAGYLVADQRTGELTLTAAGHSVLGGLVAECPPNSGATRPFASPRPTLDQSAPDEKVSRTSPDEGVPTTVLRWLRRRRDANGRPHLTAVQVEAGERIAADFLRGQLMPRVTADWSLDGGSQPRRRGVPGYGVEVREGTAAAQERFRAALVAVGPEFSDLLINVCCFDFGLSELEKARSWPKRTAKLLLQIGLTQLARHYGLIKHEPDVSKIRHAASEGYRPTMTAWS